MQASSRDDVLMASFSISRENGKNFEYEIQVACYKKVLDWVEGRGQRLVKGTCRVI
jgi:hypothetical protein